MGIIDKGAKAGLSAVGLGGIFTRKVDPKGFDPDFPGGLTIIEVIKGKEKVKDAITLVGSFMPFKPFEYGGTQKISKDYYAGNPEPVIHVLGSRENDTVIRGRLKSKRFKDVDSFTDVQQKVTVCREYQELIDGMRLRGNIVKVTLGEWRRYGIIEECSFKLNRLSDIEYEIKFSIIGFNLPKECKLVGEPDTDLISANKTVTSEAAKQLAAMKSYPESMPRTLSEFLDEAIGTVATVVAQVTGFVDGALTDIENIEKSATRAVGLCRHARATISRTGRRIGAIGYNTSTMSAGLTTASFKSAALTANTRHFQSVLAGLAGLAALMALLQARFAQLSASTPIRRHLVKQGDTLQTISMRYYQTTDNWSKIYDQNKLTSTVLTVGSVLEIPKV